MIKTMLACVALAIMLTACQGDTVGGDPSAPEPTVSTPATRLPPDPSQRGPYAVGLTRMTFTRMDGESPRVLDTWIWYPAAGDGGDEAQPATGGGPFPLLIFSHGSGGQPNNATFLTEHLASWGYVVAAPPHPGNTSDDCIICPIDVIIRSAGQRLDDVPFVLDEMLALRDDLASTLGRIIDGERTAIAGHSFGGWTAIFMAPGDRFDVSIALAPGEPRLALEPARKITSPVMIIAGGKDEIVKLGIVSDLAVEIPNTTPLSYVILPEGHHLTFIDHCLGCTDALSEEKGHEVTRRYVVAFLQTCLKGQVEFDVYLYSDAPYSSAPRLRPAPLCS